MRFFFALLLLIHGLIHLIGLIKSINPEAIPQLNRNISKTEGIIWLLTSLLLLLSFFLMILRKELWPAVAITGVIISQFLISLNWEDAKFGTLANLLIMAVALTSLGNHRFERMVQKETASVLAEKKEGNRLYELTSLPPIVQKWLDTTGATDRGGIYNVQLEQTGNMRTNPKGKWMPFSAVQVFNVREPAFVWKTKVAAFPGVYLAGRDKLLHARGEMLIKLFSLYPIVNEKGNSKINTGSLLRYLGEICWFPTAALRPYLQWETISPTSAKAILTQQGFEVEGIFSFSPQGELLSFEAARFYGAGEKAQKQKWLIEIEDHQNFDGITVPSKCKVTWKLPQGDFHWLSLEITSLRYNSTIES